MDFRYKTSQPVFSVHEQTSIRTTLETMMQHKISSILVFNDAELVTGIFTERDVIRRVALIDIENKLDRPILTVSTREVFFAREDMLHEHLVRLHFEKKIRHFPVLSKNEPLLSNVIGMITVTDVIRYYLSREVHAKQRKHPVLNSPTPQSSTKRLPILCSASDLLSPYQEAFEPIGFSPYFITDPTHFFDQQIKSKDPIIFDLDGFSQKALSLLIASATRYAGHLIMTTSNPAIASTFRPYLDKDRQTIAPKPLDIEYLRWLLVHKWEQPNEIDETRI